jgi:IclR family transcriptional regulator, pca regulon regulatory protein
VTATVQSVERALGLLLAFEHKPVQSAAELAQATGLTRPTTYRLLHTLQELGFVHNANGQFTLTPRVLRLSTGFVAGQGIGRHATAVLEKLAARTGEHCAVGILDGDEVVSIATANAPGSRYLAVAIQVGQRLPAIHTSMGRVLLAHTTTPTASLLSDQERRAIRETGHATADGLVEAGVRSIGVPVRDHEDQVIAAVAIAVSAHAVPIDALERDLLPELRAAADELSGLS